MTLAQLPGYFTAAWLIEKVGRKFVLSYIFNWYSSSAFVFGNAETVGVIIHFRYFIIIL